MRLLSIVLAFSATLFGLIAPGNSANILALFAVPAKSHSFVLNAVVRGLLADGHNVNTHGIIMGLQIKIMISFCS